MTFVIVERETGVIRQACYVSGDEGFVGYEVPADWPPCDLMPVPDGWQHGDPVPSGVPVECIVVRGPNGEVLRIFAQWPGRTAPVLECCGPNAHGELISMREARELLRNPKAWVRVPGRGLRRSVT